MKQSIKIAGIITTGILILLLMLLLLVSSGVFNPWIAQSIVNSTNKQMNGHLSIEAMEGNILSHLILMNVSIEQNNQKIASLDTLDINYSLWKIISKTIQTEHLEIKGLLLDLNQTNDGLWNMASLFPSDSLAQETVNTEPFSWVLDLQNIRIQNLKANISSPDTASMLPNSAHLNGWAHFRYASDRLEVNLKELSLETVAPNLQITNLEFRGILVDSVLSWNDLELKLAHSFIQSNGSLPINALMQTELHFSADPFDFQDIHDFIPELFGSPDLMLSIKHDDGQMKGILLLNEGQQSVHIRGNVSDTGVPEYHISMKLDALDGAYWTQKPEWTSNVSGEINIEGQGFNLEENRMHLKGQIADLQYTTFDLAKLRFNVDKTRDTIVGTLFANSTLGVLDSKFEMNKVFQEPIYQAELRLKNLNLAKLTQNEQYTSSINLTAKLKGQGFSPEEMNATLGLTSQNSQLFHQAIDRFDVYMSFQEGIANLSTLKLNTPYLSATVSGQANLNKNVQLNYQLHVHDMEKTFQALAFDSMHVDASSQGKIMVAEDWLVLDTEVDILELNTDSFYIYNALLNINARTPMSEVLRKSDPDLEDTQNQIKRITNLALNAKGSMEKAAYGDYILENMALTFDKKQESLHGDVFTNSIFGNLMINLSLNDLSTAPSYRFEVNLAHLDLSKYTENDTLKSDINFQLSGTGHGITKTSLTTQIELHSIDSKLFDMPISHFDATLNYAKGVYLLDTFILETPYLQLIANANGDRITRNLLEMQLQTKDAKSLLSVFSPANANFSGAFNARLSGPEDSLRISANASLNNISYDSISIEKVLFNAAIEHTKENNTGSGSLHLQNTKFQDFNLNEFQFSTTFNKGIAVNLLHFFASDSVNGRLTSQLEYQNDPSIRFNEIDLNLNNNHWLSMNDSSSVQFGKEAIVINDLEVSSKESFIQANGILAYSGDEDFHLNVKNLNLITIPGIQLLPFQLAGRINGMLDITGSARKPIFKSNLNIENPVLDTLRFKQFFAELIYKDELFTLKSYLDNSYSRVLDAEIEFPVGLSFADSLFSLKKESPVFATMIINQLDLQRYNQFITLREANVRGLLSLNLNLSNTLNNPIIDGEMILEEGAFLYKKLGIKYQDINMHSALNNNTLLLDSLNIRAGAGKLKMNGSLEMASLVDGKIKRLDVNLNGTNFKAFDSELIRAVVNTDLTISGPVEHPIFNGKLNVSRSTINTDIFMKEYNRVYDDSDVPLLLAAQRQAEKPTVAKQLNRDTSTQVAPDIYKNLTGQFDIEFPRNTWVKGKNMNFELAGKLQAIKKGEQIDLFGTMNVKRGFYKIYGRRLEFEEGEVQFAGGQSLDPVLNFNIVYKFRDTDQQSQILNVLITGKTSKPTIKFFLNESAIEEKDAISYLLFNRSLNHLDKRESATVNSNLSIAKDMALGQISNFVKDALQSSLGLDVIEISGNGGWTQGNVSIGKYITNNLFFNYERTFALDKKDKIIEPEKITLEYQFYRSLSLQATNQRSNSGFDLIFKWFWK